MKIQEDSAVSVPTNTTAGVEGPKKPIKFQAVNSSVLRRAAKLKTKAAVQEELKIIADVLTCSEIDAAVFLE